VDDIDDSYWTSEEEGVGEQSNVPEFE